MAKKDDPDLQSQSRRELLKGAGVGVMGAGALGAIGNPLL